MAKPNRKNRDARRLESRIMALSVTQRVEQTSGPIPSPASLAEYDALMPGLADRIVKMAEGESAHRRDLEKQLLTARIDDMKDYRAAERTGQHYALAIATLIITLGFIAIFCGHPMSGGILGGSTIVSLVGLFIYGRERTLAQTKTVAEEPEEPSSEIQTTDEVKA